MADFREFQKQYNSYLMHHGILGMHWGIRRYQNPDGSLTDAGKKRYQGENLKKLQKALKSSYGKSSMMPDKTKLKVSGKVNFVEAAKKMKGYKPFEKIANDTVKYKDEWSKTFDQVQQKMYSELEDPKKFDRFCKDYWKDHRSWFSDMSFDEYKDFMRGDGLQDMAEDWYINKYLKADKKRLDDAWNRYQESSKDGIRMMRDLIGEMPDDYSSKNTISDKDISDILNNMYWLNFNDQHSRMNLIY